MTLQSPTATLIPLFSSSELTGCGYPGLLDRKIVRTCATGGSRILDFLACKASTLSTRPGSPLSLRDTRQIEMYHYTYHISLVIRQTFFLPKQSQRSRSILYDRFRSLRLFKKGTTLIIVKFDGTVLVICSLCR